MPVKRNKSGFMRRSNKGGSARPCQGRQSCIRATERLHPSSPPQYITCVVSQSASNVVFFLFSLFFIIFYIYFLSFLGGGMNDDDAVDDGWCFPSLPGEMWRAKQKKRHGTNRRVTPFLVCYDVRRQGD
ncbi:hypothetical protein LX32DRAFT_52230 [Colletotrichum zoysiae]|uniref:Transmembrane protein n=1 Tax=Colletotrichum zoysiae TaxID=1216348 RepID=A0AAD9HBZ6_9PEZI|nr:hypothetical protein LX32DRAFT_52230 [Colletotrichum zoysiae]